MADLVMQIGIYIFAILFLFLMFIFFTSIIAIFIKRKYEDYSPDVSVIIPCYNEEKNIAKCLEQIYDLNYSGKIEVIVIDDGSVDGTSKILDEFKKKHRNLVVLKGKHQGKSESLNLGVKHSKYEIILAVDADTFIDKESLKRLVKPLKEEKIGATNGSCLVENTNNLFNLFQRIEFHYNNLVRKSFSRVFKNGIWFFGAFACYKKSVLKKIGGFKMDTMTEDMDTAMEIYKYGYRTVNVHDALCRTIVAAKAKNFFEERTRWWIGALQTLRKHNSLFSLKSSPSILFLFISQYWWTFFAVISFFLIGYQVFYWLPYNTGSFFSVFMYLFRWFSLAGSFYVLYMIPVWGISLYNIFGVLSGVISVFLIVWAIYSFGDKLTWRNILGIFFYFPYTILLNSIILISLIKIIFLKKGYFIDKVK